MSDQSISSPSLPVVGGTAPADALSPSELVDLRDTQVDADQILTEEYPALHIQSPSRA